MHVCPFYRTDLEQNLFFLALFKTIILTFFTSLQDKLRSLNYIEARASFERKNYRIGLPHYKTFS